MLSCVPRGLAVRAAASYPSSLSITGEVSDNSDWDGERMGRCTAANSVCDVGNVAWLLWDAVPYCRNDVKKPV